MRARYLGGWLTALLLPISTLAAPANQGRVVDAVKNADKVALLSLLRQGGDVTVAEPDGTTALHWAAFHNDPEIVDQLIRAGADVSAMNAFGVTPLAVAASHSDKAVIEMLLNAGADANNAIGQNETVLMMASRTGRADAVATLIARGADVNAKTKAGHTALMFAASEGHVPVAKVLISAGADLRSRSVDPTATAQRSATDPLALPNTLGTGRPRQKKDGTSQEFPPSGGLTPLLFAARQGNTAMVRLLLDMGADPNETLPDGTSALVLAVTNAHFELAMALVSKGADPNAAENGWTALHALTWVRRPNVGYNAPGPIATGNMDSLTFAKALVAHGAGVNALISKPVANGYRNTLNRIGATPLMMAARLADPRLMRVLLDLGADPKITTEDGSTVLMVAAGVGIHSPGEDPGTEEEVLECVKIAFDAGSGDVNAVSASGETALHGAAYRGAPSVVQFLVEHGARTFEKTNVSGWTPLKIAEGVYRTGTFKASPPTAAVLRQLMAELQ